MEVAVRECPICKSQLNLGVHYGVFCCQACKMFFRRVLFQVTAITECLLNGSCESHCKECRFQKCIQNGMLYVPSRGLQSRQYKDMQAALIFNLQQFDANRVYKLENCYIPGDPTVMEVAKSGRLNFQKRPAGVVMDSMEWGFISGLATIDFIQKVPCIQSLGIEDQEIVFRKCFIPLSLLADTMRAISRKNDFICFPDGTEIVEMNNRFVSRKFDEFLRSRLAGKANELKLTIEEVLLLSMVVITASVFPGLSNSAQASLDLEKKLHASALFNFCLLSHGLNGPARYVDVLGLLQVAMKTEMEIGQYYHLRGMNNDQVVVKRLFRPDVIRD